MDIQASDVVLASDKKLLARPGAVLIDDHPGHCTDFSKYGAGAVLVAQPWSFNHRDNITSLRGLGRLVVTSSSALPRAVADEAFAKLIEVQF